MEKDQRVIKSAIIKTPNGDMQGPFPFTIELKDIIYQGDESLDNVLGLDWNSNLDPLTTQLANLNKKINGIYVSTGIDALIPGDLIIEGNIIGDKIKFKNSLNIIDNSDTIIINIDSNNILFNKTAEFKENISINKSPTINSHATRKDYVDNGLNKKLDKYTSSSSHGLVYATESDGTQVMRNCTYAVEGNAIVKRGIDSQIFIRNDISLANEAVHKKYVDTQDNLKFNKSGGTISGDVSITGNLSVSGTTTILDSETLKIKDNLIETNSGKSTIIALSGLAINKNANDTYGICYDPSDDSVKLGLGSINASGVFTFNSGEGLPIVIRDSLNDNIIPKWSSSGNKLIDSGVTTNNGYICAKGIILKDNDIEAHFNYNQVFITGEDIDGFTCSYPERSGRLGLLQDIFPIENCITDSNIKEKYLTYNVDTSIVKKVSLTFDNDNTALNPTLKINNNNAKSIYYHGSPIPSHYLVKDKVYEFYDNGSNYELIGDLNQEILDILGNTSDVGGSVELSFTTGTDSYNNPFFTYTGSTRTNASEKVTVDNITYTTSLKMESSTSISFTMKSEGTLQLYFLSSQSGNKVNINGTAYTINSNGIISLTLSAGTHTITKNSSNTYLFFISLYQPPTTIYGKISELSSNINTSKLEAISIAGNNADSKITSHNIDSEAHADIRELIDTNLDYIKEIESDITYINDDIDNLEATIFGDGEQLGLFQDVTNLQIRVSNLEENLTFTLEGTTLIITKS